MSGMSDGTQLSQHQQAGVALQAASRRRTTAGPSDAASTNCALPRSRNLKEHTPTEWEELRSRFTELYLQERRRLADVSRILREERGFHATDKQYKDRIRKWGLRKNFKDDEKREALITGTNTRSGDHVVIQGAAIPRHRLKRFARDAKLLYVRSMFDRATVCSEPQADFQIVIELPRAMFEMAYFSDAHTLHNAFAAIERITKVRWPVLAFEVLGVSDTIVRYGLRLLHHKATSGVSFRMLPASVKGGEERGTGIRFYTTIQAVQATGKASEEEQSHIALFHVLASRLYQACQNVYRRQHHTDASLQHLDGQTPDLHCVKFDASPLAAQRLYLRLLAESSILGGLRFADPCADAELISKPGLGAAFRLGLGPQRDLVLTHKLSLNVAMHAMKKGDIIAGAFQFCPGFEGDSVLPAGRFEKEAPKFGESISGTPGVPSLAKLARILEESREQFLTEGDHMEREFREVSQRAALRTAQAHLADDPILPVLITYSVRETDTMIGPRGLWASLLARGCLVDRREPWKLARKTGHRGDMDGIIEA